MSGTGLRELLGIIEQNLEVLRMTAIHGSGEMRDPGNAPEDAPGESQPFDTPMFPKFPGADDLPAED